MELFIFKFLRDARNGLDSKNGNGFRRFVKCHLSTVKSSGVQLLFLLIGKHALNFFKGFAFGLGQEEVDEEEACNAPAHVEPESGVLAHRFVHVAEASNDGECAQQIETRRQRTQDAPISINENNLQLYSHIN